MCCFRGRAARAERYPSPSTGGQAHENSCATPLHAQPRPGQGMAESMQNESMTGLSLQKPTALGAGANGARATGESLQVAGGRPEHRGRASALACGGAVRSGVEARESPPGVEPTPLLPRPSPGQGRWPRGCIWESRSTSADARRRDSKDRGNKGGGGRQHPPRRESGQEVPSAYDHGEGGRGGPGKEGERGRDSLRNN